MWFLIRNKLFLFLFLFIIIYNVNATTYYMAKSSCSDTNPGTEIQPVCTLKGAFSLMQGGDTLIIEDGVYTGVDNIIDSSNHPPIGYEDNYTTIKAENMWGAVFDGEANRTLIDLNTNYWDNDSVYIHFDGLLLRNSSGAIARIMNADHIKITRCGFYETDNANGKYSDPLYFRYASYVLIEDCAIWGNGRYHYIVLDSHHFVLRRCVDRYDRGVAVDSSNMGSFRIYSSSNVILENCITLDGDQEEFYLQQSELIPATPKSYWPGGANGPTDNVHVLGSIALNNKAMSMFTLSPQWSPENISVENSVFWDGKNGLWSRSEKEESMLFNHLTVGEIETGTDFTGITGEYGYSVIAKNNIIYSCGKESNDYALVWTDNDDNSSDYNVLYNNTNNYRTGRGAHPRPNDYSLENGNEINPLENSLLFLPRIEEGSDLSGVASDGGDRGATIVNKIGVSGTLWGEPGYNITTNESLWPFPNEDIIKEYMQTYYYTNGTDEILGDRGFAVNGTGLYGGPITLTSYIWEYLGNPCPDDICNYDVPKTYYMANESCSDSNPGTENEPVCDLQTAFSLMEGGDTLIIEDGVYTGENNTINNFQHPPFGTNLSYTKIKARNKGQVIFGVSNQTARQFEYDAGLQKLYYEFEGLVWFGGIELLESKYVKFIGCGGMRNVVGISPVFRIDSSEYILFEDCYAWGSGKYKFTAYQSNKIIYRRCVARVDYVDANDPLGIFSFYRTSNSVAQNCIAIDSDQPNFWSYESFEGAFTCPNNAAQNANISFIGNIALNVDLSFGSVGAQYSNVEYNNCIGWDINTAGMARGQVNYTHCTFGNYTDSTTPYGMIHSYEGYCSAINNIIYNSPTSGLKYVEDSDYNVLFKNNQNYFATSIGTNDYCLENGNEINPLSNSLLYLPRIEDGSDLSGKASDGGDLGATILYKVGRDGTLWGEEGYNEVTDESLWPFPNEDIIKEHFASYYYTNGTDEIRGDRGFAADGTGLYGGPITLTSYIWEYLGNACPDDICNYTITDTFHKADLDHSGHIESNEAKTFIQRWLNNLETFTDAFEVLRLWRSG